VGFIHVCCVIPVKYDDYDDNDDDILFLMYILLLWHEVKNVIIMMHKTNQQKTVLFSVGSSICMTTSLQESINSLVCKLSSP